MKPTGLDSKSICAILDACAKAGVVKLKLYDMEVFFNGHNQIQDPQWLPIDNSGAPESQFTPATHDSGRHVKQESTFDEELLNDIRASQLMIDDPHGFEREIVNAHLRGEVT